MKGTVNDRIAITKVRMGVLNELWFRVGSQKASKEMGVSDKTFNSLLAGSRETINKEAFRAAIITLRRARKANLFYTPKNQIKTGMRSKRSYSIKNGMKLCNGPLHETPIWLPANERYFYRPKSPRVPGEFKSYCRECRKYANTLRRNTEEHKRRVPIPIAQVGYVFDALRLHYNNDSEMARDLGIDSASVRNILRRQRRRVLKSTAQRAFLKLHEKKQEQIESREQKKKEEVAA